MNCDCIYLKENSCKYFQERVINPDSLLNDEKNRQCSPDICPILNPRLLTGLQLTDKE